MTGAQRSAANPLRAARTHRRRCGRHAFRVVAVLCTAHLLAAADEAADPPKPAPPVPLPQPSDAFFTRADAERMTAAAEGKLAPVYPPLARYLAGHFNLGEKEGIGIDLGSGSGALALELARRSKLHWVNADINPHFFAGVLRRADAAGLGHRVSALFADAHALPFRDGYADIVVSRGTLQFWKDQPRAFREIHRVLKPGGVAFVGRGVAPDLPVEEARKVRAGSGEGPSYDPAQTEADLRKIMEHLEIADFRILRPKPPGGEGVNYGVWVEWRK